MTMGAPVFARAHLAGRRDGLVTAAALGGQIGDWRAFLAGGPKKRETEDLGRHERTGRSLGDVRFLAELEARFGRRL